MATSLVLANRLFRDQKYSAAIHLYKQAQLEWPRLHEIIDFNLKFADRLVNIKKNNGDSKYKYNYELNDSCPTSDQYDYFINGYEVLQTHQVAKDQINPQKWLSLGQDPYFVINPKEIFFNPKSWYKLSIHLDTTLQKGKTKLYLDLGSGFNERNSISFLFQKNELVNFVFYIDDTPKSIRFDPIEGVGEIEIQKFEFNLKLFLFMFLSLY